MRLLGSDPVPRERRDDVSRLHAEFEGLYQADQTRLRRYADYRNENELARESRISVAETSDYGQGMRIPAEMQRHNIPLPFGQAITVKHAYRVAGRPPDAIVDRRRETPEERYRSDTMEKIWWSISHASGGDTWMAAGAWDGSQLGASCFGPYWDFEKRLPIIRPLDPSGILVVRGLDDPHNFQRVFRFWDAPLETVKAEYRGMEFADGSEAPVDDLTSRHKIGEVPMVRLVEVCDKKRCFRFAIGAEGDRSVPLYETFHNLDFVPYVVVPNIGPERDVWGWADYEFIRPLVAYLPQLFAREADILRMVANGAYEDTGTGQDANVVKQVLAKGGVIPGKRDATVRPIEAPKAPDFAEAHAERALEMLKMLSFTPDAAWGGSDTRSGSDRALQLQPMVELTAMKQTNWSAGLSRLAAMCFKMIEKKQVPNTKTSFRGARPGVTRGQRNAFAPFELGPNMDPARVDVLRLDEAGDEIEDVAMLPRTPKDLFGGDYAIRFVWRNEIDPNDPAVKLAEINSFVQGAQSLETTLEHLGFQAPEDEMKRIEKEAERFPWLRQGMIPLVLQQLEQAGAVSGVGQGQGGGRSFDLAGGMMSAVSTLTQKDGRALDTDAATRAIPGGTGKLYGGA